MSCCKFKNTDYQQLLAIDPTLKLTPTIGYVNTTITRLDGTTLDTQLYAYKLGDSSPIVIKPYREYSKEDVDKPYYTNEEIQNLDLDIIPTSSGTLIDSQFSQNAIITDTGFGFVPFQEVDESGVEVPIEPPTRLELLASGCYQKLTSIDNRIATLIDDETTDAIDSFREMIDFLQGVTNDETFQNIINSISHEAESLDTATWPIEDDEEEEQP